MKFHPYSEVFPLLDGAEFDALVADIKEHGLREPVVRYKKMVLDGRNRFPACQKAKVKPKFRDFKGSDEAALALVVSANVARRHLSESQKAMAAARIATLRSGQRSDHVEGVPIGTASKLTGASERSTKRAREVLDKGSKALQQAVDAGDVSVSKAAAVTNLPKREQLAAAQAKPEPEPAAESEPEILSDEWEPDEHEEEHLAQAEKAYAEAIDKVMSADDKLEAAHYEIKRQAAEIAALKMSRDGYLNGKNAVVKLLKAEQRKSKKLGAMLDKAKLELDGLRERIAIMEEAAA